jgi:hypothetical protein
MTLPAGRNLLLLHNPRCSKSRGAKEARSRAGLTQRELAARAGTGGDLTTDAWIAAIAITHGASVLTVDSDFGRFPNLRRESPLQPDGTRTYHLRP